MTINFVERSIKITLIIAIASFLLFWSFNQYAFGLGVLLGSSWGCINLILIKHLLKKFLTPQKISSWKKYFLLGLKFPILYFLGYVVLKFDFISIPALIVGFILLLVIAMGVGILTLRKNNTRPKMDDKKFKCI